MHTGSTTALKTEGGEALERTLRPRELYKDNHGKMGRKNKGRGDQESERRRRKQRGAKRNNCAQLSWGSPCKQTTAVGRGAQEKKPTAGDYERERRRRGQWGAKRDCGRG
jgi:hypothetical protein